MLLGVQTGVLAGLVVAVRVGVYLFTVWDLFHLLYGGVVGFTGVMWVMVSGVMVCRAISQGSDLTYYLII